MSLVAIPVLLIGAALILTSLLDVTLGVALTPDRWFSASPVDWLYGGAEGDFMNYVRFVLGALAMSGSWAALTWAFKGSAD